MKIVVALLLLAGIAFAKDPKVKLPHIYIAYAIYNKVLSDQEGHTAYAILCRDAKGDKIVVGISKETFDQLEQLPKPTSISYAKRN